MNKQTLPASVRREINRKAHELALAEEVRIRQRLTVEALAARTGTTASDDGLCGLRPLTDAELAAFFRPVDLNELFKMGQDALPDFRKG